MKINLCGNISGNDGYASHIIQLGRALSAEGADVAIETPLIPGYENTMPSDIREMVDKKYSSEVTIFIGLPTHWRLKLSDRPKKFFGFFVWECDDVPESFIEIMNDKRIDGIIVPSEWGRKVLMRQKLYHPIYVVPHGVNHDIFKPMELERDSKFTFLFHKGWSQGKADRSGFDILLEAYTKEFKKEEKVRLIAKINPVYCPDGWNIDNELRALNLDFTTCAEIVITMDFVRYEDLGAIYNQADVFVVPSKGEGFGLTYIEAMACKVPCIATNFGGHTDFINEDNGWLLNYNLSKATGGYLTEECYWAMPDVDALRKIMREAFNSNLSIKKRLAFETSNNYTWQNSAKKILELMK